eukprot:4379451-Lingulodinium_polyedra.AAC.1
MAKTTVERLAKQTCAAEEIPNTNWANLGQMASICKNHAKPDTCFAFWLAGKLGLRGEGTIALR